MVVVCLRSIHMYSFAHSDPIGIDLVVLDLFVVSESPAAHSFRLYAPSPCSRLYTACRMGIF